MIQCWSIILRDMRADNGEGLTEESKRKARHFIVSEGRRQLIVAKTGFPLIRILFRLQNLNTGSDYCFINELIGSDIEKGVL